jgi:hypothetical protein
MQGLEDACNKFISKIVGAGDPNDIVGPTGVGTQRWVSGSEPLDYVISFANEPTASAPAQQVVITQPLGAPFDPSTLSLLSVTIPNGPLAIHVPLSVIELTSTNEFNTWTDLRPTQNLLVSVQAKYDPTSSILKWTLTSIDPATGLLPTNGGVGFLPPGAGASVGFSVKPFTNTTTGTRADDYASVKFDVNAPINTPIWTNAIDNTSPTSHVSALTGIQSCPNFRVTWSGSDVGSGLQGFSVYVSDNGGPFKPWLSRTPAVSATYLGAVGHTYSFYGLASDLTGNMEDSKASPEASTTVAATGPCGPPSIGGQVVSTSRLGTTVTVNLQLTNTGFTSAQAVNINQIMARTLSGSGTATLAAPALPAAIGPLAVGASTTAVLALNVPSTVTRFSLTENGNIVDPASKTYNYSIAQTIVP